MKGPLSPGELGGGILCAGKSGLRMVLRSVARFVQWV